MRKYRWSMLKTLEFLNSRRPDLEIRGTFIQQLQQFEQRLCNRGLGPLSFNFNDLSFKGKGFQKDLQEEEMIIRNTFLNAQMGQIVQYGGMPQKNREKTLKWIDLKDKKQNDGVITGELPEKEVIVPLAKIIPIQDTINFEKRVVNHHNQMQKDVSSCLRGTKLNKFQKQRDLAKVPSAAQG